MQKAMTQINYMNIAKPEKDLLGKVLQTQKFTR